MNARRALTFLLRWPTEGWKQTTVEFEDPPMTEPEWTSFVSLCFVVPTVATVALAIVIAPMLALDAVRAIIVWAANLLLRLWRRRERVPAPVIEPVRLRGLSASAESSAAAPAGWIQP